MLLVSACKNRHQAPIFKKYFKQKNAYNTKLLNRNNWDIYHCDRTYVGVKCCHLEYTPIVFDVHRAVHRNIIPIVKPTRCTNVSNLFYFGMTLYMFRTVFPSIIRSSRLYIQQQAFVKQILLYVQSWTPDDGRKDRPKHVECHSKIK